MTNWPQIFNFQTLGNQKQIFYKVRFIINGYSQFQRRIFKSAQFRKLQQLTLNHIKNFFVNLAVLNQQQDLQFLNILTPQFINFELTPVSIEEKMGPKRKPKQSKKFETTKLDKNQSTLACFFPDLISKNNSELLSYKNILKKTNGAIKQNKKLQKAIIKQQSKIIKQINSLFRQIFKQASHESINQYAKRIVQRKHQFQNIKNKNEEKIKYQKKDIEKSLLIQQSIKKQNEKPEMNQTTKALTIENIQIAQNENNFFKMLQNQQNCEDQSQETKTITVVYNNESSFQLQAISWQQFEYKQRQDSQIRETITIQLSKINFQQNQQQISMKQDQTIKSEQQYEGIEKKILVDQQDEKKNINIKKQIQTSQIQLQVSLKQSYSPKSNYESNIVCQSLNKNKPAHQFYQHVHLFQNQNFNEYQNHQQSQKQNEMHRAMNIITLSLQTIMKSLEQKQKMSKNKQIFNFNLKKIKEQSYQLPQCTNQAKGQTIYLQNSKSYTKNHLQQENLKTFISDIKNLEDQNIDFIAYSHQNYQSQIDPLDVILLRKPYAQVFQEDKIDTVNYNSNFYDQDASTNQVSPVSQNKESIYFVNDPEKKLKRQNNKIQALFKMPEKYLTGYNRKALNQVLFKKIHNYQLQIQANKSKIFSTFQ